MNEVIRLRRTLMFIALAFVVPCLALGQTKGDTTQEEVLRFEKEFSEAIVKNDAEAVGRFPPSGSMIIQSSAR